MQVRYVIVNRAGIPLSPVRFDSLVAAIATAHSHAPCWVTKQTRPDAGPGRIWESEDIAFVQPAGVVDMCRLG